MPRNSVARSTLGAPGIVKVAADTWRGRMAKEMLPLSVPNMFCYQRFSMPNSITFGQQAASYCNQGRRRANKVTYCLGAMRPDMSVEVAIVGGGMAGLALAVGLQDRGIDCHVFEAAAELRTSTATIISIATNGLTALQGISPGLAEGMQEAGSLTHHMKLHLVPPPSPSEDPPATTAPQTFEFPLGSGYTVVSWKWMQSFLASRIQPERIHCGHRLVGYEPLKEGGVNVRFNTSRVAAHAEDSDAAEQEGKETVVSAALLVGADGLRSSVRAQMVGDHPRWLRTLNWNAVLPNPPGGIQGLRKDEIVSVSDAPIGVSTLLVDAGQDSTYWQIAIKDTDGKLAEGLGMSWGGLGKNGAKERALAQLSGSEWWADMRSVIETTEESLIFERKLMDQLPIDRWTDAGGHVVLMGDAAHAMCPSPGQGARTAFEDAHQLCLALRAGMDPHSMAQAIKRFEAERVPRLTRMQRYAAELSGLPKEESQEDHIRALSDEQQIERGREFRKWIDCYPNNIFGDPDSKFWK